MFKKKHTTCYVIRIMPFDILMHMTQKEYKKFKIKYPAFSNTVKRVGTFQRKNDKYKMIDSELLAHTIALNLGAEM